MADITAKERIVKGAAMDYFYIFSGIIAGIYAYTYAKTLREDKNVAGAVLVMLMVLASIGLPVYRILTRP